MTPAEKRVQLDYITPGRLRPIVDWGPGPCISITASARSFNAEFVRKVERAALEATSHPTAGTAGWAAELVQWVRQLVSPTANYDDSGIALFACPKLFRAYTLPFRLPDSLTVSSVFHIKPLLPLAQANGRFYLLCLDENEAELYWGDEQSLMLLRSAGLPRQQDRASEALYRLVDAVRAELCDPGIPVVLAGTRSACLAYRGVSTAPDPAAGEITADYSFDLELFEKQARALSSRSAEQAQKAAADRYYRF